MGFAASCDTQSHPPTRQKTMLRQFVQVNSHKPTIGSFTLSFLPKFKFSAENQTVGAGNKPKVLCTSDETQRCNA